MTNGDRQPTRGIPTWIGATAIAVAVVSMSFLVWVLFKNTAGPGEAVRTYYSALATNDCDAAWDGLSPGLQEGLDREAFCASVASVAGQIPDDVHVSRVTLLGAEGDADRAEVTIEEPDVAVVWHVELDDGAWTIASLAERGATLP